MSKGMIAGILSFLIAPSAFAYDQLPGNKFFSFNESNTFSDISPIAMISAVVEPLLTEVNLLSWAEHDSTPPKPTEKYVRAHHFGTWFDLTPNDNSCFNTRGMVLARDSKTPVQPIPIDPCFVGKGMWLDPYTNNQYADAKDIQIDHVVPLKEAYIAGAYNWTWKQRCAYANFMGNPFHLLPVDGNANNKKSDSGPDRWMPPNQNFACEYVGDWLRIKAIWKLMMSEAEVTAISQIIKANRCDVHSFKMSDEELKIQRAAAATLGDACPATPLGEETPGLDGV